ncbi:MAG: exosortase/archaeosortase family protein [Phycisphaerae bacterium]
MNREHAWRPETAPPWSSILGPTGWTRLLTVAVLIGWIYWDQLLRMVRIWQSHLDWSHGFLILPFSLYLLHTRRAEFIDVKPRPSWLGMPIVLAGLFIYAAAIRWKIGYPQPLSMLVVLVGAVVWLAGWSVLRRMLFPIAFLALAMPPPERLYRVVTQPLQQLAAFVSEILLAAIPNIIVLRNGIHLVAMDTQQNTQASFTVAGACSGMRSLLAFTALGLAMAFITPRPTWHRITMAIIVLPVALFCNSLRVVATGLLMVYDWADFAKGTPHSLLGIMTFALGLTMYSLILYILDHLFVETEESDGSRASEAS